ncbi:hypothetical protein Golob_007508 [Gossypium lobatum]|uniref:Uncharacterized protein n=1 Tax=Gossypium lobatum TaxID=34289 RepID=A0A7J8MCN9_9ROSI|nr:hypothetical protein [Gossypium lobatum]
MLYYERSSVVGAMVLKAFAGKGSKDWQGSSSCGFLRMVSSRAEIYTLFRCKLKINKTSDCVKRRREIESAGEIARGFARVLPSAVVSRIVSPLLFSSLSLALFPLFCIIRDGCMIQHHHQRRNKLMNSKLYH